ncbi:MAG: amidase family protein, partial [Cereibacter changlensis]
MTDLTSLSASDLSRLVAARKVAPSEIMQAFLARIARVNPVLNAIVAMRDPDDLLAEAKAADDATGGWLHGLPLAVKDLVAVRGIRSSFGSPIFADLNPAADEMLAARMRAAG